MSLSKSWSDAQVENVVLARDDRRLSLTAWLSVEKVAYGGIALLGLGLRLLLLNAWPLGPAEAVQALPAFAAVTGQAYDLAGTSPLLFSLQRLLFSALGTGDAVARWWPAFLGGLAVLLYYALRCQLGRGGALIAAFLWAVSPMAVFTSRLGLGYGLVPPLALAVLAGMACAMRPGTSGADKPQMGRREGWPLLLSAIALGLLLASGPGAYTVLLLGLAAALVWWNILFTERDLLASFANRIAFYWPGMLLAFVASLALGATFFFTVPSGLAAAADLLGSWVRDLRPGAGDYQWWDILGRLFLSEPLLIGFALAGLVRAIRGRDRFGIFAAVAAGLALAVSLVGSGRHPADLGIVVLALTLLAGPAMAQALRAIWSPEGRELDPWLLIGLSGVLLAATLISLPGVFNPSNTASWRQLYVGVAVATAVLAVLLWLVYGVWGSWRTVALALPIIPLVLGLIWGMGQLNGLNYDRGAWRQAGVLSEMPAPGWMDLERELRDLSAFYGRGAGESSIDLVLPSEPDESLAPVLRWALRYYPGLRVVRNVPADPAPIVITLSEDQPSLSDRYSGTRIALLQRWKPESLGDFYARLRWILYREVRMPAEGQTVILWIQRPPGQAGQTIPAATQKAGNEGRSSPLRGGMPEE